jgi:uncharacterized LabA/DUF88 family protein
MTIEEIINNHCQRCNIPFDTIEALCKEVRRLTIEECKKKVKIGLYKDWLEQGKSYTLVSQYSLNDYVEVSIDETTFPTDLNNIDI